MNRHHCPNSENGKHEWQVIVVPFDEPFDESLPDFVCKHCDAPGEECWFCNGEGWDQDGVDMLCPECGEDGVTACIPDGEP